MNSSVTSQANIQSMLEAMHQYQIESTGKAIPKVLTTPVPDINKPSFGDAMKTAVVKTNEIQMYAGKLKDAYDRGEDVPLTDVVLAMQKSSLSFEATLQIRNKVLRAYEDILNMPI